WHESYAGAPADGSVREGGDCSRYARRGGSWNSMAKDVRSGNRSRRDGTLRNNAIGFRVAATLAPK
ncbi:MAG TPA: SUMF1/EgtB/PvdO family nonheme iron enzyme, partial [Rhodocyclaceae bacterium]|nr:SUMF1/EgtB/PvdO family nonheme iron enzyme [Rhodocyclaceae bacterium]